MKTALLSAFAAVLLLSCATTHTETREGTTGGPGSAERGRTLTVPCVQMGGDVQFTVHLEGKDLVLIVSYPKSIREYLGGFDDKEGKKYSAKIEVHFDTDANPDTGLKADPAFEPGAGGSEYSIGASEVTTSLARDSQGKWINGPMLMVDLNKERSYLERPDDVILRWEVEKDGRFRPTDWVKPPEGKSMRLRIPASLFGLKAGAKIRVTSVVTFCNDSFPFAGFREAAFVLEDRGPSEPVVDDGEIVNQGVDHMQRGEYDSAISLFTQALEVNPGNAEAYHNRGHAYSRKGEHDKAIADYSAAIERDPRLQAAYRYRGFLYEQKGEYEKALADYSQVIAINPGDSEAYMYRGSLYYCLGSFKEAAQDYRKMVELDGSNEYNRLLLLTALGKTSKGDYKKELAELRAFVKANASDGLIRTVSKYYLGMEGLNEAKVLKSARTGKDERDTAYRLCTANYFIAEKRLTEGNRKGARELFKKSAEAGFDQDICAIHSKAMLKLTKDRKL